MWENKRQTTHLTMASHSSFSGIFSISSILVSQSLLFHSVINTALVINANDSWCWRNGFSGSDPFIKTPDGFLAHIRWLTTARNPNSRGIWSLLTPHTTSHRFKNNKNKSKNKFLVFDISDFHWKLENYGYYILRFCNLFKCPSLGLGI